MVIEPRSQVALMRDPLWLVAGMYLEWMACIVLNRAVIARQMTRSFPQVTGREVTCG